MRLIYLIFCFLSLSAIGQSALDQIIPTYRCEGDLSLCLKQIESQSPLRFSFKQQTISHIQSNLDLENVSIGQILDSLCTIHQLTYELVQENLVVIQALRPAERRLLVGLILTSDGSEAIQEALVYLPQMQYMVLTDKNGMFRVWVEHDSMRFIIHKEGFQILDQMVPLAELKYIVFRMEKVATLETIIIMPNDSTLPYYKSRAYVDLNPDKLKIPSFGGENDAMMNVKLQSGVQNVGLGDPGLIVRGGGPDQNFVLIDGIPVYNTFHLLGLYSIFNSSTISGIKLYKDAFPSKYGSRLSSVVDVSLNNGNKQRFSGDADIGVISSGISLSGPILKDKLSFSIAGRRTYADLITYPVQVFMNQNDYQQNTTRLWYYDIFAKVHYKPSHRSQFQLSYYNGGDQLNFNTQLNLQNGLEETTKGDLHWRNNLLGLQWHFIINNQLFMTAQSAYSGYDVQFADEYQFLDGSRFQLNQASYQTGLRELRNTIDFDLFSGKSNHLLFGMGWINYTFEPFQQSYSYSSNIQNSDTVVNSTTYLSDEFYGYFESNIYLESGLLSLGMRASSFKTSSRSYLVMQPRVFITRNLNRHYQIRFSITDIGQFLHLIPNNNLGLPIDIWLPVTDEIEPLRSFQISTGLKGVFGPVEFNTGLFAKNYRNLIEHQEGSNFLLSADNWIENLDIGAGSSFGYEFSGNFENPKWQIHGSYTYCRSVRNFSGINGGNSFYSKYDRPHTIRLFARHQFDVRRALNISFNFASGNPVTIPSARYVTVIGGKTVVVEEFDEVNNFRLPATHHLDVSYEKLKQHRRVNTRFVIGVYNLYNQLNPFMVYIGLNELGEPVLKLRSYLPLMPMIKYHIQF